MKRILVLLIVFMVVPFAQESQSNENINSSVEKIFKASKKKNYSTVCALMSYTGADQNRNHKAPLNPNTEAELKQAQRVAKKIKAYLDISDSYKINSIRKDKDNFSIVKIAFNSGKQELEIDFKFVQVGNNMLLVSVE